jgi:hypothetical protein
MANARVPRGPSSTRSTPVSTATCRRKGREVLGRVDPEQLVVSRAARFENLAAGGARPRRHDLHRLGPFDPFGVARRRHVVGESIRSHNHQRH